MLIIVLLVLRVVVWLTGCKKAEEDTSNVDRYETIEEADYEFLVFFFDNGIKI